MRPVYMRLPSPPHPRGTTAPYPGWPSLLPPGRFFLPAVKAGGGESEEDQAGLRQRDHEEVQHTWCLFGGDLGY